MNLHNGAVQGHRLNLDAYELGILQSLKQSVEYAALGPTVHARVDRVPVAKALWKTAPLAAMFGNVQDGIENLQVRKAYIAPLPRQTTLDLLILSFGDFHTRSIPEI